METNNSLSIKEWNEMPYISIPFENEAHLNNVCHILSDYIIEHYEEKFIYKIVFKNIEFFTKYQKREIYKIVLLKLQEDKDFYAVRHRIVFEKLKEYFLEEHTIIINGFAVFRLNEYINVLENYILTQIDEYLIQKDYDEFLELMKYFVNLSEPKCAHIDAYFDGKDYHIYNQNHMEITDMFSKDLLSNYEDVAITADDIFLSLLINIAPTHICIHNIEAIPNKELLNTIQKIFGPRIEYQNS